MRRRTPATSRRRGAVALVVTFVAAMVGVLLAPTAASAAPGHDRNIAGPTIFWTVKDSQNNLVGGATFEVRLTRSNEQTWAVADCVVAPCSGLDLDPEPGEFQFLATAGNGSRTFNVKMTGAPDGGDVTDKDWHAGEVHAQATSTTHVEITGWTVRAMPRVTCAAGTYYSVLSDGWVREVAPSGAVSDFGRWSGQSGVNALGISASGTSMYALQRSGGGVGAVLSYATNGGFRTAWSSSTPYATSTSTVIAGAVSPTSGVYYFGGFADSGGNLVFRIHRFDPSSATPAPAQVGTVTTGELASALPPAGANGDLAFDRAGNLMVIYSDGLTLRAFTVAGSALASGGALTGQSVTLPSGISVLEDFNGIAIGADGAIAMSNRDSLRKYDPVSFRADTSDIGGLANGGVNSMDLASCGAPPTLTIRKQVVSRVNSADQFEIQLATGTTVQRRAVTGAAPDPNRAVIPATTVRAGQAYTVRELLGTASVSTADYEVGFTCTNASFSGQGATRTVTVAAGADADCSFTNTSLVTRVTVRKELQDVGGGNQRAAGGWSVSAAVLGSATPAPAIVDGATAKTTDPQGSASWTVRHSSSASNASIGIGEIQQRGYRLEGLSCSVTDRSGVTTTSSPTTTSTPATGAVSATVPGVTPGSTVDCTFVNRELPTTLTLINEVYGASPAWTWSPLASASAWSLTAAAPANSLAGPSGVSGVKATVSPNVAYTLGAANGPAAYTPALTEGQAWQCSDATDASVPVAGSGASSASVTLQRGSDVTCRIVHETSRLVLLQQVEGAGGLAASDFELSATPAVGASIVVAGTSAVRDATVAVRPGSSFELISSSDSLHVPLRLERYTGELRANGVLDSDSWAPADALTDSIAARSTVIYRFVALSPLPFALPITGGIGADLYQLGGLGLLVLAIGALVVRALRRRLPMTPMSIRNIPASPQEGTATMATIKKSRAARIAAGAGALALASLVALGGAAPASAAAPGDIEDKPGSITIHKFAEPEQALTALSDGVRPAEGVLAGLTPLGGIDYKVELVPGTDLATAGGWETSQRIQAETDQITEAQDRILQEVADGGTVLTRTGTTSTTEATRGQLTFGGLDLGLYLVTETSTGVNDIAFEAEPFLVSIPMDNPRSGDNWLYDVHVFPKNSVTSISKELDPSSGQGLGASISWTIRVDIPEVPVGGAIDQLVVRDTLDPRLGYERAEIAVTQRGSLADERAEVTVSDSTYTVTDGPGFSVAFDETARQQLAGLNDGELVIRIFATVDSLGGNGLEIGDAARTEDGLIDNTASVDFGGGVVFEASSAQSQWGALRILKHDSESVTTTLSGATFRLYASQTELDNDEPVAVTHGAGTDRVVGQVDWITGDDGTVFVPGLQAGSYLLVETIAPNGYVLESEPRTVVVAAGVLTPVAVEVANTKVPAYALPVTGGDGQLMFMLGGAGLVLLAVGFALVRRRKADQQA